MQKRRRLTPLPLLPFMTPWFGPKALTQTGLREVVSQTIGQYADQRILQAAVDTVSPGKLVARYDFSSANGGASQTLTPDADGAIWIDYVADSGDGFDSTYAIARLVSEDMLTLEGMSYPLPAGQILFCGGDQAYPYASEDEYRDRFIAPFDIAAWYAPERETPRKVFLLPGNHDWYDGLSSFDRLFCGQRDGISEGTRFGVYQCEQHRSYWAVRLPHDWWVWGLDIQLTANLDVGQMQYFSAIANALKSFTETLPSAKTKAKIILCIATPSWLEGATAGTAENYSINLQRVLNLAIDNATVCCVLAGDWHHYARYFSKDHRLNLITSGGGGAYMAPTHQLPSEIDVPWKSSTGSPPRMVRFTLNAPTSTEDDVVKNGSHEPRPEAVFPPRSVSRKLSWLIPAFPIWNPTFCGALGFLYFLMYWLYTSTRDIKPVCKALDPSRPFCTSTTGADRVDMDRILEQSTTWLSPWEHLHYLFASSRWNPMLAIVVLSVFGLIYGFLAGQKRTFPRLIESTFFWLMHVFVMAYLAQALLGVNWSWLTGGELLSRAVITSTAMWVLGGGIAGTMCGVYLFLGNRLFNTHHDNAFSSIRVSDYKNFLRMRITKDELTIYPIGLEKVPSRAGWREPTAAERATGEIAGYVPRKPLMPHLIEGPIVIRPADIVQFVDEPQPPPVS